MNFNPLLHEKRDSVSPESGLQATLLLEHRPFMHFRYLDKQRRYLETGAKT